MQYWFNQGNGTCLNLAVGANQDGRLELFTYENAGAGRVLHKWQEAPNSGWSQWAPFAPVLNQYTYHNVWLNGHTDLFVGLNGARSERLQLVTQGGWTIAQQQPNGGWGQWSRIHDDVPPSFLVSALGRSANGRLYAFGVDQISFDVRNADQNAVGGAWSGWRNHGHPLPPGFPQGQGFYVVRTDDWRFRSGWRGAAYANQGVGSNRDGRIEIFGASPYEVWHRWQTDLGNLNAWSAWTSRGKPTPIVSNHNDWVVIQNQDGRLEAFVVGDDYELWHTWQLAPDGVTGWSGWAHLKGSRIASQPFADGTKAVKGKLRAARDSDGCIQIFAVSEFGDLRILKQLAPNGNWPDSWLSLGGEGITAFDVGQNEDGRLEAFIVSKGSVYHRWQVEPGRDGRWSTDSN